MRSRYIAAAGLLVLGGIVVATASAGGGGIPPAPDDPPKPTTSHVFPVPAKHTYGDGWGAGRGHEGQDIFARCGKPIIAARGGRVKYRAFQSGAGNYIVINARGTPRDYMYAHLKRRAPLRVGQRVRTGQQIGRVGATGNASGCHLHFELWRGDWNGRPDVTRKLRRWDKYS